MTKGLRRSTPASLATAVVLLACVAYAVTKPSAKSAAPFHASVVAAFASSPLAFGGWRGEDVDAPVGMQMLQPTAFVCRRYAHDETGEGVLLLLIHSSDARHLVGHTPAVCYPSSGWRTMEVTPMAASIAAGTRGAEEAPYTEYRFGSPSAFGGDILVANLTVLPIEGITTEPEDVERLAAQPQGRLLGGSQIQLVFTPQVSRERRQEIVAEFLQALTGPVGVVIRGESNAS